MSGSLRALFAAALAFAPPGFRREYGRAIRDDFERALSDARELHGPLGASAYALGATSDLLTTSIREYAAMLYRDFSFALRSLRKTPTFTFVVIGTLALAIGANVAVFGILDAVVLAPLPYVAPERLVEVEGFTLADHGPAVSSGDGHSVFSLPDYAEVVASDASVLSSSAAFTFGASPTLTGHGRPLRLNVVRATSQLFATFGARPEIGRFPSANDVRSGYSRVVVISDALWRTRFGADPAVVDSSVQLDGSSYRVTGVAPPNFQQPVIGRGFTATDAWMWLPTDGRNTQYGRGWNAFYMIARLAPGVDLAQANAALERTARVIATRHPVEDTGLGLRAAPLADSLVGSVRGLLFALFAAVFAVLLVACANVANLLSSRAASRDRELSVRVAVGASRGRIIAQLLVEVFVLACSGGLIGLALAEAIVVAFRAFAPASIPRSGNVTIDGFAALYTFGVVAFCTLVAGLAPAFAASRGDVVAALKSAGRGGDATRGARARNLLVAVEIAMTLALVIGAGLVVRSYVALTSQSLGFEPDALMVAGPMSLPDSRYGKAAEVASFVSGATERVGRVPGVDDVAWVFAPPFVNQRAVSGFTIRGRTYRPGEEPQATINFVGPDYFTALGARIVAGRAFAPADRAGSVPVAIVNAAFARTFFPGRSPLGAHLTTEMSIGDNVAAERTIVGIAPDVRRSFAAPAEPELYLPIGQFAIGEGYFVVTRSGANDPSGSVDEAITSLDPLLPAPKIVTMRESVAHNVDVQRLSVLALATLAFVALALALAGVFAVVSYGVAQRTHEFGVRLALGADSGQIVRSVLGGALRLAAAGIFVGLIVAGAGTRLLAAQLFDTRPLDPITFAVVTVIVLVAAMLAAFVPARRATRVDPIVALRYE